MPLDITKELQKTFNKAVMQHEAKSLKEGQDWQQARVIIRDGETERAALDERYLKEYDTRLEIVRKRLNKEAAMKTLDHPVPIGRDKFESEAIDRQAHREVQFDHERVLQQSLNTQDTSMQALQDKSRKRDLLKSKGKAKEQFEKASDRRHAPDRRSPTRNR